MGAALAGMALCGGFALASAAVGVVGEDGAGLPDAAALVGGGFGAKDFGSLLGIPDDAALASAVALRALSSVTDGLEDRLSDVRIQVWGYLAQKNMIRKSVCRRKVASCLSHKYLSSALPFGARKVCGRLVLSFLQMPSHLRTSSI